MEVKIFKPFVLSLSIASFTLLRFSCQIKYLVSVGSAAFKQTISRMMELLSPQVALEFNWCGRGNKRAFTVLNIYKAVRHKFIISHKSCLYSQFNQHNHLDVVYKVSNIIIN